MATDILTFAKHSIRNIHMCRYLSTRCSRPPVQAVGRLTHGKPVYALHAQKTMLCRWELAGLFTRVRLRSMASDSELGPRRLYSLHETISHSP